MLYLCSYEYVLSKNNSLRWSTNLRPSVSKPTVRLTPDEHNFVMYVASLKPKIYDALNLFFLLVRHRKFVRLKVVLPYVR